MRKKVSGSTLHLLLALILMVSLSFAWQVVIRNCSDLSLPII